MYMINSKYIESKIKLSKKKQAFTHDDDNHYEQNYDSANTFPGVMKRMLNLRDKPIQILQRTNKVMKHKDPALFEWNIYFLSSSTDGMIGRNTLGSGIQREEPIFDQLINNITDKKFFHRKGYCMLKSESGNEFKEVLLILTGDHLYYVNENTSNSLNLILLSKAELSSNREKKNSFEIRSNSRKFILACKSQHDMDNWISAILAQIEHTKCKHEILELQDRIQFLAKDVSKDESKNQSRKQFLTYLESLEPEEGALLQEHIEAIHNYKSKYVELAQFSKKMKDGSQELNEDIVSQEKQILSQLEKLASDIIWNIYAKLKRAKSIIKDGFSHDEFFDSQEPEEDKKSDEDYGVNKNLPRRVHYAPKKDVDSIDVQAIEIEHDKKFTDYRSLAMTLQVLILCPAKVFLKLHEKFLKMKSSKVFDKYLFTPLEENINLISKENFYNGKPIDIRCSHPL